MKKRKGRSARRPSAEVRGGVMVQDAAWGWAMGIVMGGVFLALWACIMTLTHGAMEHGRIWALAAKSVAAMTAGFWSARRGGRLAPLRGTAVGGLTLVTALGLVGVLGGALPTGWTLALDGATGAALGMAGTLLGRAIRPV